MMKKILLTLAALAIAASGASAEVLWDQSDYDDVNLFGIWNSESGCAPFGGTFHVANDIQLDVQVTINTISTYYTNYSFEFAGTSEAYLWIGLKSGNLPITGTDNPSDPGLLVPVTVVQNDAGHNVLMAENLSITLTPGEYWVSLTPIAPGGPWGPEYNIASLSNWGDDSAKIEYCGMNAPEWLVASPGKDASILIEGTIDVVATETQPWGNLKALYR